MCGIAGFNRAPGDDFDGQAVAFALLRDIVTRGEHATGAAWHDPKRGKIGVSKLPVPAGTWIKERGYLIEPGVSNLILHTRFATQGSTAVRGNNHPITSGNVVGVHNGIVYNDAELFRLTESPRHAQVDSEAVMSLIDTFGHSHLGLIRGDAALAWINRDQPTTLHLARVVGRPLMLAQTVGGSLLFASTMGALIDAGQAGGLTYEWTAAPLEATYLRVKAGRLTDQESIEGVDITPAWRDTRADGKPASGKGQARVVSTRATTTITKRSTQSYPSVTSNRSAYQPGRAGVRDTTVTPMFSGDAGSGTGVVSASGASVVVQGKRARRRARQAAQRAERVVADRVSVVAARNVAREAQRKAGLSAVQRRAMALLEERLADIDVDSMDWMSLAELQADAEVDAMDELMPIGSDADRLARDVLAGRVDPTGTNDTSAVIVRRASKGA